MTVSPFDHPLLSGLLGDASIAPQFSVEADFEEMNYFEEALARAEAAEGIIPEAAAHAISIACAAFEPEHEAARAAAARDGVVVPEYLRQLREQIEPPYAKYLHFGATSQDVIDTSLVLRLRPVLTEFGDRLQRLIAALADLDRRFGKHRLMGRTRMQDALPISVDNRLAEWRGPLPRHLDRLEALTQRLLVLQFGGAVGTLDKLGAKAEAVTRRLGEGLDLPVPNGAWHSQRDNLAEFADWLALVSGSLGKIGIDIALMAQNGELSLTRGGSSSAMPHKSNPVGAEVLVTLARYNATLVGGMHQAQVHEQERSGAAWTLEWFVLPQMVMTTASGLRTALDLIGNLNDLGEPG